MSRKKKHTAVKLAIVIMCLVAAVLIAFFLVFRIRNIEISGNKELSDDDIKHEIRLDKAQGSTILLWFINKRLDYSDNDMVRSIDVRIASPTVVKVSVVEQNLVGAARAGTEYCYFNEQGIVTLVTDKPEDGIPVISGISVQNTQTGTALVSSDDDKLTVLIKIASILHEYSVDSDTIEVSENGRYTVQIGNVTVNLGRGSDLDEKISELSALSDKLKELSGTLHLEHYNAAKDTIIFTKDTEDSDETDNETSVETDAETEVYDTSENTNENYILDKT